MKKDDDKNMLKNTTLETTSSSKKDDSVIELIKAMLTAAAIALLIRSFIAEPFNIPSGSLLPTLQIGDYLFVEKYAYGYSKYSFPMNLIQFDGRLFEKQPARGDIAVFRQPKKIEINYIKRIIGLPGDEIVVKNGVLNINGKPVMRDFRNTEEAAENGKTTLYKRYIETLPNGLQHNIYEISDDEVFDQTHPYTIPEGFYFVMGDNRDSSLDSRAEEEVGMVPAENLIGRAWFIFFSIASTEECGEGLPALGCKIMKWPQAIRYSRIFKSVNKI